AHMRGRFHITAIALVGVIAGAAGCQDVPKAKPAPVPAQQTTANPDARARFDALVQRYDDAQQAFSTTYSQTKDEEARKKLIRPGPEFIPEFESLANESQGSDVAAKCWLRIVTLYAAQSKKDDGWRAAEVLLRDYMSSPALVDLPGT